MRQVDHIANGNIYSIVIILIIHVYNVQYTTDHKIMGRNIWHKLIFHVTSYKMYHGQLTYQITSL